MNTVQLHERPPQVTVNTHKSKQVIIMYWPKYPQTIM